jgi:hypothetical protein
METYILVDSKQRSSGGSSNTYTYNLKTPLKSVFQAELLSAVFPRQTNDTQALLDVNELRNPRQHAGCFAVIPTAATVINSNVVYTTSSFFPILTKYENPFDIDRLSITWRDATSNGLVVGDNTLLFKISHIK